MNVFMNGGQFGVPDGGGGGGVRGAVGDRGVGVPAADADGSLLQESPRDP